MVVFLSGLHGVHAVNLVEEEHQSEPVSAIVQLRPLVANPVLARHSNLKTATSKSAQVSTGAQQFLACFSASTLID